jgi:hypothetical protein
VQVISVLSIVFVSISIVGMTINTLPRLQYQVNTVIFNPSLALIGHQRPTQFYKPKTCEIGMDIYFCTIGVKQALVKVFLKPIYYL